MEGSTKLNVFFLEALHVRTKGAIAHHFEWKLDLLPGSKQARDPFFRTETADKDGIVASMVDGLSC